MLEFRQARNMNFVNPKKVYLGFSHVFVKASEARRLAQKNEPMHQNNNNDGFTRQVFETFKTWLKLTKHCACQGTCT
jgi:hypothetical protein